MSGWITDWMDQFVAQEEEPYLNWKSVKNQLAEILNWAESLARHRRTWSKNFAQIRGTDYYKAESELQVNEALLDMLLSYITVYMLLACHNLARGTKSKRQRTSRY